MRSLLLWSAMLALAPASAQTYVTRRVPEAKADGYAEVHASKAVEAGQQARIWWAMMLNPDCTAAGTMDMRVLEQPKHGQLILSDDPFYPSFVDPNPRSVCDRHKAPGKQAFYTADVGFHGHDKVVLRNATSEGRMRRITIDLDVR